MDIPTSHRGDGEVTVLVVEPDSIIRRTILNYLERAADIVPVDGGHHLKGLLEYGPMDVILAGCHLLDEAPPTGPWRVVGIGPRQKAAGLLRQGRVAGFIATDSDPEQFRTGVRAAGAGLFVTSPCLAKLLAGGEVPTTVLTDRERCVLNHLQQGASNREIAAALFVSVSTVKATVSRLLRKLGVRTRAAAAAQGAPLTLDR